VTRRDLPPGSQAVQAAHAALEFAVAYPEIFVEWHRASNTLVMLATPDEASLSWLCADAAASGLRLIPFYEPDLGDALTAVALEPAARRLVAHLPLALYSRGEVRT
jgi:hypothetical protein